MARRAALFYTLLETAKLSLVDPAAYLRSAATRAISEPGAVIPPPTSPDLPRLRFQLPRTVHGVNVGPGEELPLTLGIGADQTTGGTALPRVGFAVPVTRAGGS